MAAVLAKVMVAVVAKAMAAAVAMAVAVTMALVAAIQACAMPMALKRSEPRPSSCCHRSGRSRASPP